MESSKLKKISLTCELGASNHFSFSGFLEDGSEVRVTGAGGQKVALFRKLLRRLATAYPDEDYLPVEVQGDQIVGEL
jgi:hypothetical protein